MHAHPGRVGQCEHLEDNFKDNLVGTHLMEAFFISMVAPWASRMPSSKKGGTCTDAAMCASQSKPIFP